jgi:signal transduction histidine kinase
MQKIEKNPDQSHKPDNEHHILNLGHDDAEDAHKKFTAKIVLPVMSITALSFYAATVTLNKTAILVAIAGLLTAIVNFWITTLTGNWRATKFKPRADALDAIRWSFNLLLFDSAIIVLLKPTTSTLALTWTILLLAASADLFHQAYRSVVVGLGLICGAFLVFWATSDAPSMREQIFLIFCMVLIVFVFSRMETYWTEELKSRIYEQKRKVAAEFKIMSLTRDAMLGHQSRMISHELVNLIQILDILTQKSGNNAHEKLRQTVFYIKQVNKLVLEDLGQTESEKKDNFGSVLEHVKMLIIKEISNVDKPFLLNISEDAKQFDFKEYSGSLFLILRNLLKNASDAKKDMQSDFSISVAAEVSKEKLVISISDNGEGMNKHEFTKLMSGEGTSTKSGGHGIGFRFVVDQCLKNNFKLSGHSEPSVGSTFVIAIDRAH